MLRSGCRWDAIGITLTVCVLAGADFGWAQSAKRPKRPVSKDKEPATATGTGRTLDTPRGQWADLQPLVDVKKRGVIGPWRLKEKAIEVSAAESPARLPIPVAMSGSYDLKLEFTRVDGDGTVGVILPIGSRQCLAALNFGGGASGLDTLDGRRAADNASSFPGALSNDRRYALEISVRPEGTEAAVTVNLDGRTVVFYRGPANALALHKEWAIAQRNALGLAAQAGVVFHSVQLRVNSGTARLLP